MHGNHDCALPCGAAGRLVLSRREKGPTDDYLKLSRPLLIIGVDLAEGVKSGDDDGVCCLRGDFVGVPFEYYLRTIDVQ